MNPAVVPCYTCRRELAPSAMFCPGCGSPRVKEGKDELLGKVLGDRFLIIDRIGHGKSGTLYRGEHVTLRRKVAVKVLHDELSRDDLAVERFRREATSVAELDNEHIVEIHDFGRTADSRLYMAMELLEGETLDETLAREQRLDVERVVDVMLQVGDALAFAHSVGFVHRDLRPRNIFLSVRRGKANFVKLLDFGLSKLVETGGAAASTSLGMTFGDPRYMSPEQAKGDPIDRRADLYSLGCIAYEMLTGAPPFVGGKVFEVLSRHVSHAPMPLAERRADAPPWLQAVVMKLLAKAPDDRFLTATRLVEALQLGVRTGETMHDETTIAPDASGAAASSRRGPTGTPAVGVPAVAPAVPSAPVASAPVSAPVPAPVSAPVPAPVAAASVSPPVRRPEPPPVAEPDTAIDEAARPRTGGRRRAGTADPGESANLSGSWFASDGDSGIADADSSVARSRRTIHPGDSLYDDEEYAPEPRRWVKPLMIVGGLAVAGVLILLIAGRGGHGGGSTPVAAIAIDAGVPAIDAGVPAIDAGPAIDAAPERHATSPVTGPGPTRPAPEVDRPVRTAPVTPSPPVDPEGPSELDRRLGHGPGSAADPATPEPPTPVASDEAGKLAEFYAQAGDAALRGGDPVGAAGNYNKALASNKSNLEALIGLGEVALQQGLYSDAVSYLKKASKVAPRSARISTLMGEAYLNSGNVAAAEAAFKKALQIDPDSDRARNGYNEAAGRLPPVQDEPGAP